MSLTKEDIKTLTAPFNEQTLGVKINNLSRDKTKAMLICYLQHTDVYSRLEEVDPSWSAVITNETRIGEAFITRIKLTVKGVERENEGEGDTPKASVSDAMKRAAMLFGVGRYLYDAEQVWIPYSESQDKYRQWTYEDYKKALKPKQAQMPMPGDKAPVAPIAGPSAGPKIAPVAPLTQMSRVELGAAINKIAKQMRLDGHDMTQWVQERYKKTLTALTMAEMNDFYEVLQAESGQFGAKNV